MSNNTTAYEILTDLEGRLEKCTHKGDTLRARCPAHEDKTPSLDITIGDSGDRVVLICRAHCTAEKVVEALGLEMRDLFATDDAWRSHITYVWLDHSTGSFVKQTRYFGGNDKYRWETGAKKASLVYLSDRYHRDTTRPIVWTEGAKAADAAAAKLPADDYDVIGFPDSTTIPNAATLAEFAKGRSCIVWGDYDRPGEQVARRLVSALRQAGADDVTTIDPERLGLTAGRHDDAAEWRPGDSPGDELRAACVAAKPEESSPVPMDRSEQILRWVEELKNENLDGKRRILRTIAASSEWQQLGADLRIVVVDAIKGPARSIATVILGRYDDRKMAWCDPPGNVDTGVEHFRSIWTYTAEATPVVLVPGLAWRGRVSKIAAAPKLGKTSLITNGIAAWQAGQTFLGEQTGPPGSVLYVSETGLGTLRAWFEQYGCPTDAPIDVGGAAAMETIATSAREHKPDLVVIDSLTDLHAASDGGNIWNAGDVRKLLQPLRELECAVILVHHVRKSDGKSRDSGDFEAAPDMNIYFDPGSDYGGNFPPPGDRRLRYSGRWEEPERTLTFDNTYGYALKESTGGKGPTGEDDPFTAKGPDPTLLDTRVIGYIMKHPKSSSRKISDGIECNRRDLKPSLVRLEVARRIASERGPRRSILWSVTTTSPTETTDMDGPPESSGTSGPPYEFVPLVPLDPLNKNGAERNEHIPVDPVEQTLTKGYPVPLDPLNENGGKRVERDRADPALAVPLDSDPLAGAKTATAPTPRGGSGAVDGQICPSIPAPEVHTIRADIDATSVAPPNSELTPAVSTPSADPLLDGEIEDGENTEQTGETGATIVAPAPDRSRPAPEVHSSGVMKWDDATSTWVPDDDCWLLGPTKVRLGDGLTVTDGDPGVHKPSRWTDDQWYAYEQRGMVH